MPYPCESLWVYRIWLSQHTVPIANTDGLPADPVLQMVDSSPIPGLTGIPGDLSRQNGGRSPRRRMPGPEPEAKSEVPSSPADTSVAPEPTPPLIQALDRLRATQELRPVESDLVRALRGARHYQEESRHDLPLLDDPAAGEHEQLPPDQVG